MIHTHPARCAVARGARLLGRAARRARATRRRAASGRCASPTTTGSGSSSSSPTSGNPPLRAEHPEIPAEHAIVGVEGARAYAPHGERRGAAPHRDARLRLPGRRRVPPRRRASAASTGPTTQPAESGIQGAGTVHHIAWATRGRRPPRLAGAGRRGRRLRDPRAGPRLLPLDLLPRAAGRPVRDRDAARPGFAVDEDPDRLGEELRVPKMHAAPAERLERTLTPVVNPRRAGAWRSSAMSLSLSRAPGERRPRPACSSSTTAAAPTSTTCSRSPTARPASGACTSSRRARR